MQIPFEPVTLTFAIAALVVVDRRLKAAAQPLRLQFADRAEEFLQLSDIPDQVRDQVKFMLDHAFRMRALLVLSILAIPMVGVVFAVRRTPIFRQEQVDKLGPKERQEFYRLHRLHNRITLANHWILYPIVELEMVLVMPLAIMVRALIYGRVPEYGGSDSVMTFIEYKSHYRPHLHLAGH